MDAKLGGLQETVNTVSTTFTSEFDLSKSVTMEKTLKQWKTRSTALPGLPELMFRGVLELHVELESAIEVELFWKVNVCFVGDLFNQFKRIL